MALGGCLGRLVVIENEYIKGIIVLSMHVFLFDVFMALLDPSRQRLTFCLFIRHRRRMKKNILIFSTCLPPAPSYSACPVNGGSMVTPAKTSYCKLPPFSDHAELYSVEYSCHCSINGLIAFFFLTIKSFLTSTVLHYEDYLS
jgi:hypothetical protein